MHSRSAVPTQEPPAKWILYILEALHQDGNLPHSGPLQLLASKSFVLLTRFVLGNVRMYKMVDYAISMYNVWKGEMGVCVCDE
jgi:hypothetical protein